MAIGRTAGSVRDGPLVNVAVDLVVQDATDSNLVAAKLNFAIMSSMTAS